MDACMPCVHGLAVRGGNEVSADGNCTRVLTVLMNLQMPGNVDDDSCRQSVSAAAQSVSTARAHERRTQTSK